MFQTADQPDWVTQRRIRKGTHEPGGTQTAPLLPLLDGGMLVLADGTVFAGTAVGAEGTATGEVVFNTAMTGYQEIATDPSYAGQIITMTTPHIGNYGIHGNELSSTDGAASLAYWLIAGEDGSDPPWVVLSCARRAASLAPRLSILGRRVEVVSMPCAGAIDAGRLLEILDHGAERVLVAGCKPGTCRYGGARLGQRHLATARELLRLVGGEAARLQDDWSGDPDHEAIAPRLPEIMAATWAEAPAAAKRGGS